MTENLLSRCKVFRLKTLPFFVFVFLGLLISGCVSDVEDPDLPEGPSRLVLASFISPEDPEIKVAVSRSVSLLSPGNNGEPVKVTNAVVLLSDGTDTIQLPYIFNRQLYATSNFSIQPGRQYWLKVTTADGLAAEATCIVPSKFNQSLQGQVDSVQEASELVDWVYEAVFNWQDLAGEGDYYKIDAGMVLTGEFNPADTTYVPIEMSDEPLVRDFQADGRHYSVRSASLPNYREVQKSGRLLYLQAYLLTTDKPMYEYHRSLTRYQRANSFTDPVKLYSNVKNGFGVFGAYRKFAIKIPVR